MLEQAEQTNGNGAASVKRPPKRKYVSQSDVPRHTIDDALRVANAIDGNYGKEPTRPLAVAKAMGMKPSTGTFQTLTGASAAYGFTEGGAQAELIGLTELGMRAVAPTEVGDDHQAKREALLRPRITREFLTKYDGSQLPPKDIGRNVLAEMGVTDTATDRTLNLIIGSARELELVQEINGTEYVDLSAVPTGDHNSPQPTEDGEGHAPEPGGEPPPTTPVEGEADPKPNAIFLGHGKSKKPLEQLTKILSQYKIPYRVAEDEPHRGRPISKKVKDLMDECGAGILIFSADEEYFDAGGESVWKPSENVVNELGAAGVLYDDRIVVFKEVSVQLATNYRDLGHIEFEKDKLDAKGHELIQELVSFGILKLSVS